MSTISDDPAFPFNDPYEGFVEPGLTKRELFAKDFMAALLSNPNYFEGFDRAAAQSIQAADALIKKLNETGG